MFRLLAGLMRSPRCRVSPDRCAWAQCLRCYRGVRPRVVLSPVPNLLWVQPKPRPLCVEGTSVWATLRFELNLLCVWPTLGFPCTGQPRSPCSQRLSAPALTSPAGMSTRRPLPIRTQTRLLRVFATVDRNRKAIVRCAFHYFQRESGIVGIG